MSLDLFFSLYIAGGLISIPLTAGWLFAYFKSQPNRQTRSELGGDVFVSLIGAIVWPIFVVMTYCMTGFAEHGWSLKL